MIGFYFIILMCYMDCPGVTKPENVENRKQGNFMVQGVKDKVS